MNNRRNSSMSQSNQTYQGSRNLQRDPQSWPNAPSRSEHFDRSERAGRQNQQDRSFSSRNASQPWDRHPDFNYTDADHTARNRQETEQYHMSDYGNGDLGSPSRQNLDRGLFSDYGSSSFNGYGRGNSPQAQSGYNNSSGFGPLQTNRMGKAPKGYKRSDERIREDVCETMTHSGIDASEVEVSVQDGIVTLSGTIESRQMKRSMEDAIEHLSGVHDVKNEVKFQTASNSANRSATSGNTKMSQGSKSAPNNSNSSARLS